MKVIQESYQDDLMTIGVQLNSLEATLLEKLLMQVYAVCRCSNFLICAPSSAGLKGWQPSDATQLRKADSGTVMSRREVLERFQLFEAARNVKLKDLEEALSRTLILYREISK